MTYIDIHCHLEYFNQNKPHSTSTKLQNQKSQPTQQPSSNQPNTTNPPLNLNQIIKNAKQNNVKIILTNGINKKTNRQSLEFSKKYDEIKSCMGLSPTDALKLSPSQIETEINFIKKNFKNIIAIGEVGLDLKEAPIKTLEKQKKVLEKFVKLAKELNLPVFIHSRKAETKTIELLEKINYNKIIMHCFCGKKKLLKRIIENKWFLSIPTNVKFSQQFQEIVKLAPIEQLFCETDSPFLHPDKKFPNEPKNIIESYKKIAEIKGISLKKVEEKIYGNFQELFLK